MVARASNDDARRRVRGGRAQAGVLSAHHRGRSRTPAAARRRRWRAAVPVRSGRARRRVGQPRRGGVAARRPVAGGDAGVGRDRVDPWRTRRLRRRPRPSPWPSRLLRDSGYFVSRMAGGGHLVFDAGPHGFLNGGHAHADALAVVLTAGGEPVLVDPGTATYTMDAAARDRFRSSRMHNTLVLDGAEHARPDGPFHWQSRADARFLVARTGADFDFAVGTHDGHGESPPFARGARPARPGLADRRPGRRPAALLERRSSGTFIPHGAPWFATRPSSSCTAPGGGWPSPPPRRTSAIAQDPDLSCLLARIRADRAVDHAGRPSRSGGPLHRRHLHPRDAGPGAAAWRSPRSRRAPPTIAGRP